MGPHVEMADQTGLLVSLSRTLLNDITTALQDINAVNRTVHILSMNARVEAARAGDAGRGFAVVAAELTRLSSATDQTTRAIEAKSKSLGGELSTVAQKLSTTVAETRYCDLAHHAMDLVDRNLYERSCDVRWWATDSAVVACAGSPEDQANTRFASRRLGQILDSYTVYADLVLADLNGKVLCNGRPNLYRGTIGSDVRGEAWFQAGRNTTSGSEFGFQPVHDCKLTNGERSLVYSCSVRDSGQVNGRPLGVLGIVFRWDALGQRILQELPLTQRERAATRACIIDLDGRIMADTAIDRIGNLMRFEGINSLLTSKRGAIRTLIDGRRMRVCHAAAPGFESYTTGWHCILCDELGE